MTLVTILITFLVAFLKVYWLDSLLVLLFMVALVWLWKRGKRETVRHIIYDLVVKAEQKYGSKTGPFKWIEVWVGMYEGLPWIVRLVFTKKELDDLIEDGVDWLKKELKKKPGINLLTYAEEAKQLAATPYKTLK